MKIKTGKHTAFEVKFVAKSWFESRNQWYFFLPYIEVAHVTGGVGIFFCAFFWSAGVRVTKVEEE